MTEKRRRITCRLNPFPGQLPAVVERHQQDNTYRLIGLDAERTIEKPADLGAENITQTRISL